MKRTVFFLVLAVMSVPGYGQTLPKGSVVRQLDLAKYFRGTRGCFVLFDFGKNEYLQYMPEVCATRYTPCSTFKIANSLIALETGVAPDTSYVIRYDSSRHPIDPALLKMEPFIHWPHDQTMATAIRYSVVWYYQEIAKMIGPARMQQSIDSLSYGNRDISSGIDRFWLSGSLKISADEQVELIKQLVENRLKGFSVRSQEMVKGIMLRESTNQYELHAKTGGGEVGPDSIIGWYVGFVKTSSNTYVFALNLFGTSFEQLAGRRTGLTKQILHGLRIL
jgi:beta-lactamase class D